MSGDLNVKFILQAVDRMSPTITKVAREWQTFGANLKRSSGLDLVGAAGANVMEKLKGVSEAVATVSKRFAFLGSAGGLLGGFVGKQIIDTASQFEAFNIQLTALEGSGEKAKQALAWAEKFAQDTPLELAQVIESYAQLRAFGLDPTDGTLQALADTAAKQGKGFEQVKGMALALGQAWTKTKLQGDDILQLVERGVPVWDMLSKATGKSAVELQEMSSKGLLGRKTISLLVEEMGKASQGASAEFAKSWAGQLSMIADKWTTFRNMIAAAGLFDALKAELVGLNARFDAMAADGTLQQWAQDIGSSLVEAFHQAKDAFRDFAALAQAGWQGLQAIRDLFGSWQPVIVAVAAVIAGPLIASVVSLATALVPLGVALMATPFGWVAAAIGGVVAAGVALYQHWGWLSGQAKAIWDAMPQPVHAAVDSVVAAFNSMWQQLKSIVAGVLQAVQPLIDAVGGALGGVGRLLGISVPKAPEVAAPVIGAVRAAQEAQTAALGAVAPKSAFPSGQAPSQQRFGGEIGVRIESAQPARVTHLQASSGLDLSASVGRTMPQVAN